MKKVLPILAIMALFAVTIISCNKKPETAAQSTGLSYADTFGLAQFQAWKMQHERLSPNQYDPYQGYQQVAQPAPVHRSSAPRKTSSSNYGSGSMSSGSEHYAKTQKKGWSKAAKGGVIGGAGGAIAGAVINKKNRVAGGVIGGVVGAGIGYLIGHAQDKKDGR